MPGDDGEELDGAWGQPARPAGEGTGRRTDFVQSLDRGLAVIRCFSSEHPSLTLSEVAERTGLTRAAARRFLLTLQELGYVGSSGRQFSLRPRVLALGYAYLSSFSVAQIAQPHLEDLAEELHESCSVSVLDGDDLVYVARASANRIMTISLTVGTRLPPYPTSMGRVLLANLPEAELDETVREIAEKIASAPKVTVNMARRVIRHLSEPSLRASMDRFIRPVCSGAM